jgi:DNA-binding CsgD family transcriptional regulator
MRCRIVRHRVPVLLLTPDATVLYLNEAARELLGRPGAPRLDGGGRLACAGPAGSPDEPRRTLGELLRAAARARAVAAVVPLPAAAPGSRGRALAAVAVPLRPASAGPGSDDRSGAGGVVALLIGDGGAPPPTAGWLAAAYGLTPAEAGVALAVVEAGGLARAASSLGISRSTARTHLQHVFQKTGVHRQAELVRLLLTAGPAAGLG